MKMIKRLGDRYGFKIIEDASHAVGATYEERPVGSCQYSDAVVFSFHPVKIITSGEGGMVTTNDQELAFSAPDAEEPRDNKGRCQTTGEIGRRLVLRAAARSG